MQICGVCTLHSVSRWDYFSLSHMRRSPSKLLLLLLCRRRNRFHICSVLFSINIVSIWMQSRVDTMLSRANCIRVPYGVGTVSDAMYLWCLSQFAYLFLYTTIVDENFKIGKAHKGCATNTVLCWRLLKFPTAVECNIPTKMSSSYAVNVKLEIFAGTHRYYYNIIQRQHFYDRQ